MADPVRIRLFVGKREAGHLDFEVADPEWGSGVIRALELDEPDLLAELQYVLGPDNPERVLVRSTMRRATLATSLDGVTSALGWLVERYPVGRRRFHVDASQAYGKFGTFWDDPDVQG